MVRKRKSPWDEPDQDNEEFWRELAGTPKAMWREPLGAELNGLGKVPVEAGWKGRGWVGAKQNSGIAIDTDKMP